MKIISWNVNGIRAVHRKGALELFLQTYSPDVLFLQETKATQSQVVQEIGEHSDFFQFFHAAQKPGYAGTALWISKKTFSQNQWTVSFGMPEFDDTEGRIVRGDFLQWTFLGVYFPNGGKSKNAWLGKLAFYKQFLQYVSELRNQGRQIVFCGDVNCAHEEIDIARPKENKNSIGFLPEERAWVSEVVQSGFSDVFRHFYPDQVAYSWWDMLTRARERNVGWRLDYFFMDERFLPSVKCVQYLTEQMGSDHCPVILEGNF